MSADVAMTKKGFGEMAITGTMAGPIFNILVGQGLSLTLGILKQEDPWKTSFQASAFTPDGSIETTAVLPISLIVGLLCVLVLLLVNALKTNFKISYKWQIVGTVFYGLILTGLVVYCCVNSVNASGG